MPEDPDDQPNGDWAGIRAGFRTDWKLSERDALTVEGDLLRATSGIDADVPALTAPFKRHLEVKDETSGGNLVLNWRHRSSDQSVFTVTAYFDHTRKNWTIDEHDNRANLEFQHTWIPAERHEVVWGLGFRYDSGTFQNSPLLSFRNQHGTQYSAFLQDEIRLAPNKVFLIAGTKFEHNPFTGLEVQPSLRLLWTPSSRASTWLAVSRAVRTPSYFELGADLSLAAFPTESGLPAIAKLFGSPNERSETLRAHEAGYRTQLGKRFSVDWAGFYNVYGRLSTSEPAGPFVTANPPPFHLIIPNIAGNRMRGESVGTETAATLDVTKRWRINAAYSWLSLQLHLDPGSGDTRNEKLEGQSPEHKFQVRSKLDLTQYLQFDASTFYVGALPASAVPAYTRLDARLGWRPRSAFELSIGGQNLQGGQHLEFISEGPFAPARIGRSLYLNATFQF
jgi:iron complex outermembrane receptor protein